ncbi:MAG TPA: DUF4139 domain-containing protein [Ignavibacteriaceae bacterium]|nr:DUF4139 domain-containing protein [Ignavibacteriaceae bacterium]
MKNKSAFFVLSIILLPTLLVAQQTEQRSIAVTVYNQNLGVVKDVRNIDIKSGISSLAITDVAQNIDPTSVHINLNGDVLEQNYQYDLVSLYKILAKYIDRDIKLIGDNNEIIEGNLLSASNSQIVLRKKDGGLLMLPSLTGYRLSVGSLPEGLITKPTLLWMVHSPISGKQDVEISYQTSGMNWHAEYVVVLNKDDSKLDLNSWVSIENNSGTTFRNAKLKLVAGDLNLVKNQNQNVYNSPELYLRKNEMSGDQFQEKSFFEYHIYNLKRPTTLAQNETKQISLFEAQNIRVHKKYLYSNNYRSRTGQQKVAVIVEFENSKENSLGVPMPKGKIRVYKSDGESNEFIGEDMIDHTPKMEKIKLKIGDAFDILAEETQTDHKKISDKVFEDTYKITLKNRKEENVVVQVDRRLGLNWEILKSSLPFKKDDAQNISFQVPVKKNSETELTYTVRYSY